MLEVNKKNHTLIFTMSSETSNLTKVSSDSVQFATEFGAGDCASLVVVLRELLVNAIQHGNAGDPGRAVKCRVERIGNTTFKVVVEDEGPGFAYDALDMTIPEDPRRLKNRGYKLINALSDKLEFNESGNLVTVTVTLPADVNFTICRDSDWVVITPSGSIEGNGGEKIRALLRGLVQRKCPAVRFDLSRVETIDLLGLNSLANFSALFTRTNLNARLEIVNASPNVAEQLRAARVTRTAAVKIKEKTEENSVELKF